MNKINVNSQKSHLNHQIQTIHYYEKFTKDISENQYLIFINYILCLLIVLQFYRLFKTRTTTKNVSNNKSF